MIEFIEKERYYDDSAFTGQCWMYPTFMVKDGIEYFMRNRREPDDSWKIKEREDQKAELLATMVTPPKKGGRSPYAAAHTQATMGGNRTDEALLELSTLVLANCQPALPLRRSICAG